MRRGAFGILLVVVAMLATFGYRVSGAAGPGDWAYWRGPAADGMAVGDAPVTWSDTRNVAWKTDIPGLGNSSPVLWGDQIFVTTAVPTGAAAPAPSPQAAPTEGRRGPGGSTGAQPEHRFDVLSLDRKTGRILWQRTATTAVPHEGHHAQYGSFASHSPVTDGKLVYAFFGSRGMFVYDLKGTLVWKKDFGVQMKMRMAFGEGMGPVIADDRLLLVFDHDAGSFMVALDKATGKELWRVARDERSGWAAPLVVDFKGRKQVIVPGSTKVRSYDLRDGAPIWECSGLGANAIPHPVRQDDMVLVMTGYQNPKLMAIRLGRDGDLTGTDAVVWTQTRGTSYTPSPVVFDNRLYVLTDSGTLSCFNARTGEPLYHQTRLPKPYSFKSSLVGANGKLYMASEDGDVVVVKMGETFEVLATNSMPGETFIATPAITGGEIFLRGKGRLYCIRAQ
jgi:outer membrane protein assembly factor BamB